MKDVENALKVVKRNIQILEDRSKNGRIDARVALEQIDMELLKLFESLKIRRAKK
jgi:HEAT repeat protein